MPRSCRGRQSTRGGFADWTRRGRDERGCRRRHPPRPTRLTERASFHVSPAPRTYFAYCASPALIDSRSFSDNVEAAYLTPKNFRKPNVLQPLKNITSDTLTFGRFACEYRGECRIASLLRLSSVLCRFLDQRGDFVRMGNVDHVTCACDFDFVALGARGIPAFQFWVDSAVVARHQHPAWLRSPRSGRD